MSWYSLDLLDGVGELVEDSWTLAWDVARSEDEADFSNAIFQKSRPGKRLTLYFSPAAQLLAEAFGAKACARPSPTDMSLVAGDERAWQIHFGRVFARPATGRFLDTGSSGLADLSQASPLQ
jgi:hypothetical protein